MAKPLPLDVSGCVPALPSAPADAAPLRLQDCELRRAVFAGADLRDADLQRAALDEADLRGADLRGARLARADLTLVNLSGADLRGADLSEADLSGADLRGARLDGADLTDAELSWAWVDDAAGLPATLRAQTISGGRVAGEASSDGEPAAGMRSFARADAVWVQGRLTAAERHFRTALRWVPDSDAVRYHLGALCLERGDPYGAELWWRDALRVHDRADRARIDLALLRHAEGDRQEAQQLLRDATVPWFLEVATALLRDDREVVGQIMRPKVSHSPGLTWLLRPPPTAKVRTARPGPDDAAWVEQERAELTGILRDARQPAWVWHGTIARALSIGAMDLAQRADQRLRTVAPEHRLWSLQLQTLDLTAQAFAELLRTRWGDLGPVQSLQWVALGVHGPTAKITCESGVFYAKRYLGGLRSAGSVAYTHRVARGLAERGLQVPVAMPDWHGDDVMVFGDDLLALYPEVGGRPLDDGALTVADARQLGETLARIHMAGAGLETIGRPRGGVRTGTRLLRSPHPAKAWQAAMTREPGCAQVYGQFALANQLGELLEVTARRLSAVLADCPTGLVHGDFAGGNVLHGHEQGVAVVDWDLADADLWVWDLARAMDLSAVDWSPDPSEPHEINAEIARAVLAGYHAVRPLREAEKRALPVLIAASRVDLDAEVLPIGTGLEPAMGPPVWQRQVSRLSRAAAGAPELAEALRPVLFP